MGSRLLLTFAAACSFALDTLENALVRTPWKPLFWIGARAMCEETLDESSRDAHRVLKASSRYRARKAISNGDNMLRNVSRRLWGM